MGGGIGLGMPRPTRVVKYLLIANFAVYILAAVTGQWNSFLHQWGSMNPDAVLHGQVWRLVTYEYLHDPHSIWHILFNMLGVYFLGPPLERSWGPRKFFIFYTVGGVLGALFYMMLAATGALPQGSMIGASGCVLAVLGACALLFPQFQLILFVFPVPIRFAAVLFCGIYVLNLISQGANAGGDAAHLAGLAYGVLWPLYGERWLRNLQAVRQYSKEQRHTRTEQQTRAELDRILRKVHEQGVNSLTAAEKRTLADATRRQQGR
jgi:membrane associated rhomboid family serine protease